MLMNILWTAMVLGAMICGALTGKLADVANACTQSATQAVNMALNLVGVTILWLGLMRILHEAGLFEALAQKLKPLMRRLFAEVPPDHPAMGMMVLNMTANMLGLGNAATPFGLKAMQALETLNAHKGVASNAMVLFLAINTSGLAVLPTGMIALRASLGSQAPGAIVVPTLLATFSAAVVGILSAKWLAGWSRWSLPNITLVPENLGDPVMPTASAQMLIGMPKSQANPSKLKRCLGLVLTVGLFAAFGYATYLEALQVPAVLAGSMTEVFEVLKTVLSSWTLLLLFGGFVVYGVARGVNVYQAVIDGGQEGFALVLRMLPYLVAILVAVGMLRASGALDMLVTWLAPLANGLGMPKEALPMALLRPLTGQGAYAVAADTMKAYGPDSLVGQIVSTLMGSTETTFYVLALYLGVVDVRHARHALLVCLLADLAGTLMAVWSCRWLLT